MNRPDTFRGTARSGGRAYEHNLHALRKSQFRQRITTLSSDRHRRLCEVLNAALGCPRR